MHGGAKFSVVDDRREDVRIARVLDGKNANSVHSGGSSAYSIEKDHGQPLQNELERRCMEHHGT